MRLHYRSKYNGDENSLPQVEHKPGAVQFKEFEDMNKLALIANGIAVGLFVVTLSVLILRGGWQAYHLGGCVVALLCAFPHEFLHAICFKEDVYLYTNWKQGMLFVVGPEDMSKLRFVFMSMLPNLVFGIVPFLAFCINPSLTFLGSMGAIALPMGAGDYYNVFNAMTQMPKGSRTYMSGMHSYWYMPE